MPLRLILAFLRYRLGVMVAPPRRRSSAKLFFGGAMAAAVMLVVVSRGGAAPSGRAFAGDHALRVSGASESLAFSHQPTPEPGAGMAPADRLAPPKMSDPPTQLELGHWEYNFSCMVCHGDQGQGLTPEWRTVLDPEDRNCWQARCHGPSHPPYGFEIPKTAPKIIGTGALAGYKTTAELFELVSTTMPWSYPGLFEDEVYWQITAYLADENKVDLGAKPLSADTADAILLLPELAQTHHSAVETERMIAGVVAGLLLVAAFLHWAIRS